MTDAISWRFIGWITLAASVVFLIAALFAYRYEEILDLGYFGRVSRYPYQQYVFPLAIATVLSFVVSMYAHGASYLKREQIGDFERIDGNEHTAVDTQTHYDISFGINNCPNCGRELPNSNCFFCPFCGKKL